MSVSIITPTLNASAFIEQCVDSVSSQGQSVVEHIIVDGGSTDGTLDKVHALAKRYEHLRVLYGPDNGQSDAMNKGTFASKGNIIGFLNADDFYEQGAVSEASHALSMFKKPGMVVGDCRIIDEVGTLVRWNRPRDLRIQFLVQIALADLLPANPSAYFYHREVHDIVGGYDVNNNYSMDIDFILTAARMVPMKYVPRHWGNFRLIPGTKSFENAATNKTQDPLGPILHRHRAALGPIRKASMPFFDFHTRMRRIKFLIKERTSRSSGINPK